MAKENFKTAISVLVLVSVLTFSYFKMKREKEFDPFTLKLNSPAGTRTLGELNKNKIVLLYFGFLSCPDACPTTLSTMAAVFKELPPAKLDKISFLFVGLDPERDTLKKMGEYALFFHPKILPISLMNTELDLFTNFFGIAYLKVPLKSSMGYTIDHSTDIIVLSPDRKFLEHIDHGTPKNLILLKLNKLIDENFNNKLP
jgi:protein SCO1/2